MSNRDIMNGIDEKYLEEYYGRRASRDSRRKNFARIGGAAVSVLCVAVILTAVISPMSDSGDAGVPTDHIAATGEDTPSVQENTDNIYDDPNGHGFTLSYRFSTDMVHVDMLVKKEETLSETMKVYTYPYGTGQGGTLYGDLNDEETESVRNKLESIAEKCFGCSLSDDELSYDGKTVTAYVGETRLRGTPGEISLLTEGLGITEESLYGDLSDVKVVSGIIDYLGISEPVLMNFGKAEERNNGDYYIFDKGADAFESEAMEYIILRADDEGDISAVFVMEIAFGEAMGEYKTLTYEEALSQIKDEYPEINTESVKVIKYYKFDYRQVIGADGSYGGDGYYVPYYRFFVEREDEAPGGCAIIDVAMVDFEPGDTIVLE